MVQGRPMDNNLSFRVDSFGSLILPGHLGFKVEGERIAANAVLLKEFLVKNDMQASRVVACLGCNGVITRSVKVPQLNPKDLDSMMKLNIGDHLPVSPEEYAFDYKVLQELEEDGRQYLELMVAAVQHSKVEQCALLLERAGLKPLTFDILPNVIYRLFGHLAHEDHLVLDSGQDGSHITVFKGSSLFMYNSIPFALDPQGFNDFSVLAGEVRGFLDYFSSRNFGKGVDTITVVGELAAVSGLQDTLGQFFAAPATVGLSQAGPLTYKGKAGGFASQAAVYAGNLGLMMRSSSHLLSVPVQAAHSVPVSGGSTLSS